MTVQTNITVAGTTVVDYKNLKIERSQGDFNASSTFRAILDTPSGRHATDFTVGDEVVVKADQDASPTTKIFTGILEKKEFRGKGTTQELVLRGRDFSARLQDVTVEPSVFTNSEVSTIVTNIMDNFVVDVTTNNVNVTETTLARISFNQESVFDALKQLSKLSGFVFFVDEDKDLHFEQAAITSSGVTLDNTNTILAVSQRTREQFANRVWVYGDRYFANFKEILLAGSPFDGTDSGSVFTLVAKPHNTEVTTSDFIGNVLVGGIFGLTQTATSGPDYLVNFHDREIIFVSGTDVGYSALVTSGGSVIVNYDREIPIVKFGEDRSSIEKFGPKTKVINDKTIKDPATATAILKKELEDTEPSRKLELDLKSWFTFKVGETVTLNLPDFDLVDTNVPILNITYKFDRNTIQSEKIITVRLDEKVQDIVDELNDLRKRLELIEGSDRQDTDVITRLEITTGSSLIVGSYFEVRKAWLGSGFVLGGSGISRSSGLTTGPNLGRLGSFTAGSASHLGFAGRTSFLVQTSGGFAY